MEAKQVSQLTRVLTHLVEFDVLYLKKRAKIERANDRSCHVLYLQENDCCVCVLPDEADIVRGFEKVGGGSGLLSMIVPETQRPFALHQEN